MPVLVLSASAVAIATAGLSAPLLTTMIGRTMHAVTADSKVSKPAGVSITAIKIVAVPKPGAAAPGLPATTLLFDEETGKVSAMINAAELTGIRTASASLILELFPIRSAAFVVRSITQRAAALADRLQSEFPSVEVTVSSTEKTKVLVSKADIICLCVPSTEPVFEMDDLKMGVHINAIGSYTPSMHEFTASLISPTSSSSIKIPNILVDHRASCLAEAGELIEAGIAPESLVELGEVVDVNGDKVHDLEAFGLRREGRSLFKAVGIGAMDVAIAKAVVSVAEKMELGSRVEF